MTDAIKIFVDAAPPSANRIWLPNRNGGKPYLNPAYEQFKALTRLRCVGVKIPKDWECCAVEIIVHPKKRSGDVDNRIKATLDALTFAGVWTDDSVVAEVKARFGAPDKKGCTLIVLTKRTTKFPD